MRGCKDSENWRKVENGMEEDEVRRPEHRDVV
jgi:hypothetical protein